VKFPKKRKEATPGLEDHFRREIKAARKVLGLTQAQLAQRAEAFGFRADQTIVARIERGERGLGLDEAAALAGALGMSLVDVIAGAPVHAHRADMPEDYETVARGRELDNQVRALRNAIAHMTVSLTQANALVERAYLETADPRIAAAAREIDEGSRKYNESKAKEGAGSVGEAEA